MHIFLWLIGLWAATVFVIWRIMFVLDQPPRHSKQRGDNVIPFRVPTANHEDSVARIAAGFPISPIKKQKQPSRRS